MNALLTLLLLAAVPQEAEAPVAEEPPAEEQAAPVAEPEARLEATTTGYLDTRFTWAHVSPVGLVPATGVPALANLSEGNMQVKLRYGPSSVGRRGPLPLLAGGGLLPRRGRGGRGGGAGRAGRAAATGPPPW